jgi:hypothetical protein
MPASGRDVFWKFVFRPDVKATCYVRAIEIKPGIEGWRDIHHANLLIDRMGSNRRLGDGFYGMDFTINENPFDPDGHFLFWKPGTLPYCDPDGFAWRLDPGNLLLLNAHLQPSGKVEHVVPRIGLYFTDKRVEAGNQATDEMAHLWYKCCRAAEAIIAERYRKR